MGSELENDGINSEDTQTAEVPVAINDAFEKLFGDASDADIAKIEDDENTEVADSSAGTATRKRIEQEQADELEQEGIVTPDDPDGVGKPAAVETKPEGEEKPAEQVASDATAVKSDVDPGLRFAANELGWSDEQIDKLYEANPELADKTFTQLADTYTNLSRQFLTPGPTLIPSALVQEKPAQPEAPTSNLDKFYAQLEQFAESNGEELAGFAKALKAEIIDPVKSLFAANEAKQNELYATEARSTMTAIAAKFPQFYGTEGKATSDVEKANQAYVAQVADQLRAGAKAQGTELSIKDALNRAHLIATAAVRDQIVRKEIKAQVQTRSKGMTAKPTQRRDPKLTGGRSDATAIEAAARKMAEIGMEDQG